MARLTAAKASARLRRALAALPLSAWPDGQMAVAVSNWLRPDAETSPGWLFCHCYARQGKRADNPGLAVLVHRAPGAGPHLVDAAAGTRSGAARPMTRPR
jgi:hypothetical protein